MSGEYYEFKYKYHYTNFYNADIFSLKKQRTIVCIFTVFWSWITVGGKKKETIVSQYKNITKPLLKSALVLNTLE